MRVHPAVLLVLVALTVPVVVELRTMLVWIDVELSIEATIALGLVLIALLVGWALLPPRDGAESGTSG